MADCWDSGVMFIRYWEMVGLEFLFMFIGGVIALISVAMHEQPRPAPKG